MGANVWQRDSASSGTTFKVGPAPCQYPARPGKRKLVWTKDQQDQPATPAVSAPGLQRAGEAPSTSYSQPDHFEKRARLNGSYAENGHHHGHESYTSNRSNGARHPVVDKRQQQTSSSTSSASASRDPAAVQAQQQKAAELAELKRRIQQQEAQLLQQKKQKEAQEALDAQEARHEQGKRRAKLEAGFAEAFKRAKQVADAELAQSKGPLKLASADEIRRVLNAKTDYDCLQVQVGADALTIKRKYKELAVALHPDKCKAEGATDAFQRLVKAYQNLLKYAKQQ